MSRRSVRASILLTAAAGCTFATPVLVAAAASAQNPAPGIVERHATGGFEVIMTPESETRFMLAKTFTGGLTGTSNGTFIGDTVATAYVAIERFEGTLDGRRGSFVMLHRGFVSQATGMTLDVIVAPGSGTGELTGITGRLAIGIEGSRHSYDLSYTLPGR